MKQDGFTLVELAIGLVIIGLMTGVYITAQQMIHAAEMNKIVTDVQAYRQAISSFQEKYAALPGDMPDADVMWSECVDEASNPCNGNGDGGIVAQPVDMHESFRAWQHLALSRMIKGQYTGQLGTGDDTIIPGENMPEASLTRGVYSLTSTYALVLLLGALDPDSTADHWPNEAVLSPVDAMRIDEKIDDSHPDSGKVRAMPGWEGMRKCTDNDPTNPAYAIDEDKVDLEGNGVGCMMLFTIQ